MASYNRVMLMGNLTRDPEVRYTPDGTAVADLGVAVSETFKNREGQQTESTCFVDVVVWARQAETCGEYLRKGSPVFIEGKLQLDKWQNKEGETRSKLRVRAMRVQFLGSPKRETEYADGSEGGYRDASGGNDQPAAPAPAYSPEPAAAAPAPAAEPAQPAAPAEPVPGDLQDDEDNLPF